MVQGVRTHLGEGSARRLDHWEAGSAQRWWASAEDRRREVREVQEVRDGRLGSCDGMVLSRWASGRLGWRTRWLPRP